MADLPPEILAFYNVYSEADRLVKENRLEFLRTVDIIERSIARPPAVVADVGGGPGVYARWLAKRGYRVHLFDAVQRHVDAVRRSAENDRLTAGVADARRIPMDDASADAVLLLGPLYHLVVREDRMSALREAHRILRPGGVLFAAGISRFASAIDGAVRDLLADPTFRQIVDRDLIDGQHRNPTNHPGYFTTAFFHLPEELLAEVIEADLDDARVLAVESIGWAIPDLEQTLAANDTRDRLLGLLRRIEGEPGLLGASPHLLVVARRPVQ
jgi:ubiquinone/menaquinone biosynthesis C-methylase UbiE